MPENPMPENPSWFNIPTNPNSDESKSPLIDLEQDVPDTGELLGENILPEDAEQLEKIRELKEIVSRKNSDGTQIDGLPAFMVWAEKKTEFSKHLQKKYILQVLMQYQLFHLLGGSSEIAGTIHKFDLPNGEIEKFIRTGEFDNESLESSESPEQSTE